jgi:hypothetical protein
MDAPDWSVRAEAERLLRQLKAELHAARSNFLGRLASVPDEQKSQVVREYLLERFDAFASTSWQVVPYRDGEASYEKILHHFIINEIEPLIQHCYPFVGSQSFGDEVRTLLEAHKGYYLSKAITARLQCESDPKNRTLIGRLPPEAFRRMEEGTATFMADFIPRFEREANRDRQRDAKLLQEMVQHFFDLVGRETLTVCESAEEYEAALRGELALYVHFKLTEIPWLSASMRKELNTGFTFFVRRVNPWAGIPEKDRASVWRVGASTGEALTHVARKLRAEAKGADGGGASWQAIEISFLSDERVQIRNGTNIETHNYGELGFADRRAKRGKPKPNQAWVTLRAMAEQDGIIRDGAKTSAAWPRVEKRIQEIRRVLRKHFGIADDPIPFIEGTGYQARFKKIGCSPSFHT